MSKFRVVVWCDSCQGDDEGCFGGKHHTIGGDFDTREDAEQAGAHYCTDLPYHYRVEDDRIALAQSSREDVERLQATRIRSRSGPSASFSVF
jgi:hypothetical protein